MRPAALALCCLAAFASSLPAARGAHAGDPAPPPPAPAAQAAPHAADARETRVLLALMQATGRVTLRYLEEKQDPEKAAAYEAILRALAEVTVHLAPGEERAAVATGMKAMLGLMPKLRSPKGAEVMRGVMATMAQALAEAWGGDDRKGGAPAPRDDLDEARALLEAVAGGLADGLFGELTAHSFLGATLATPSPDRPGFPVREVRAGSAAEAFGLRTGDTIVRVRGGTATWRRILRILPSLHRDGAFPPLTVLRDGAEVELGARPPAPASEPPAPQPARPR